MESIPHDKTYDYIWLADTNNIVNLKLDSKRTGGGIWQDRPLGVKQMQACAAKWGNLKDCFRTLHPTTPAYTRITTTQNPKDTQNKKHITKKLIDRIFASPCMFSNTRLPRIRTAAHVRPTMQEKALLSKLGSTS